MKANVNSLKILANYTHSRQAKKQTKKMINKWANKNIFLNILHQRADTNLSKWQFLGFIAFERPLRAATLRGKNG